ncbi:MAG: STAS domain-containing protein [Pseudomonadota bacterium]|nr:STAS domain-containing protein [Pseudomonadota bacterium]
MSVDVQVSENVITITVTGSFDISCYEQFNDSYRAYLSPSNNIFVIDMEQTTYMDSSALGMLLLLRDRTGGERSRVMLVNVGESVMEILKVANFNQLFNIQPKKG